MKILKNHFKTLHRTGYRYYILRWGAAAQSIWISHIKLEFEIRYKEAACTYRKVNNMTYSQSSWCPPRDRAVVRTRPFAEAAHPSPGSERRNVPWPQRHLQFQDDREGSAGVDDRRDPAPLLVGNSHHLATRLPLKYINKALTVNGYLLLS